MVNIVSFSIGSMSRISSCIRALHGYRIQRTLSGIGPKYFTHKHPTNASIGQGSGDEYGKATLLGVGLTAFGLVGIRLTHIDPIYTPCHKNKE